MVMIFRRRWVVVCFWIVSYIAIGQETKKLDSISSLLKTATTENKKADLLLEMGKVCLDIDPVQSQLYLNQALTLAEKSDYHKGLARIYIAFGDLNYWKTDSFRTSLHYYEKGLDRFLMLQDKSGMIEGYYKVGMAEFVLLNYERAIKSIKVALDFSKEEQNKVYTMKAFNLLGLIYKNSNKSSEAITHFEQALDLARELNDVGFLPKILKNLGNKYHQLGYSSIAVKYYLESLELYRNTTDSIGLADILYRLGLFHSTLGNMDKAFDYELESLELRKKINSHALYKGESLSGLGSIYVNREDYRMAIEYYKKALVYYKKTTRAPQIQMGYTEVGVTYEKMGKYKDAVAYLNKALELNTSQGIGGTSAYGNLMNSFARISLAEGNYEQALVNVNKAMEVKTSTKTKRNSYKILSEVYYKKEVFNKALHYFKKYIFIKDSLMALKKERDVNEFQTLYEVNKKIKEIQLLKKENEISALNSLSEINRQKTFRNGFVLGGIVLVVIVLLIYSRYRLKHKANRLLASQNKQIEDQNLKILDSINYARRIQDAILTSSQYMDATIGEYFVYYQPKDIVSGDFYWVYEVDTNNLIVAVADCTGHGVPGAFMSMMGNSLLNEIIIENGNTQVEKILDDLRSHIIKALKQDVGQKKAMDGMDISLLKVDRKNQKLTFAGAGQRIYLLRDGKCLDFKGDAFPVGFYYGKEQAFNLQEINIHRGDKIYLTTDGFIDQFGGPNRKKFGLARFKDLIIKNSSMSIKNQKEIFLQTFQQWTDVHNQIDDILVMGIKM